VEVCLIFLSSKQILILFLWRQALPFKAQLKILVLNMINAILVNAIFYKGHF